MLQEMYCARCRAETAFEQPPCVDGHDEDCPEWVCVLCGSALVGGVLVAGRSGAEAGRVA